MIVTLHPTLELAGKDALAGRTVVVIDVLRASSVIVAALDGGAERIIPVGDVATASRIVRPTGRDDVRLLAGERRSVRVEGFNLGNSPLEFTPEVVRGKTIVLATTNGTRAIAAAARASRVVIAALTNVGAVAEAVRDERELIVLCCGTEGNLAAEDLLCGGILIASLGDRVERNAEGDASRIAVLLAERFGGGTEAFLRATDHGRRLIELGFEGDIVACARRDVSRRVPEVRDGSIPA